MGLRAKFKMFFVVIAISIAVSELLGFIYFSFEYKKPVSGESIFPQVLKNDDSGNCLRLGSLLPHPYLMTRFSVDECRMKDVNSYGILGPELPENKNEETYAILLTGASVAAQVATFAGETQTGMSAENYLQKYLNAHYNSPNGKPFRIYSAAVPGSNTPVPFIAAALFLRRVDHVVSVEGFNEHWKIGKRAEIEDPPPHWFQIEYSIKHPISGAVYFIERSISGQIGNTPLRHSFTVAGLLSLFHKIVEPEREQFARESLFPSGIQAEQSRIDERNLAAYLKYIRMTDVLAQSERKKFTFFIQPSAYRFKKLTADEDKLIDDERATAGPALEKISRYLLENSQTLPVLSLEKVFENHEERLYRDFVHPNAAGLKILIEDLARQLAQKHQWKSK